MFDWLLRPFQPKDRFRIAATRRELPRCDIRLLQDSDFAACEDIYRRNEPGRFPDGYFEQFSEWLRQRRALILVAETAGEIRAFGGLNAERRGDRRIAALTFGMVDPDHHKTGFGTTLLLARMALLRGRAAVFLSTAGGSETFYGRFGFRYRLSVPDRNGYAGDTYCATLAARDPLRCRAALRAARLSPEIEQGGFPIPTFAQLSPAGPAQATDVPAPRPAI